MSSIEPTQAKIQVAVGAALTTVPAWTPIVQNISLIASMIAAVTGAVIGLHGVYRIIRNWRKKR